MERSVALMFATTSILRGGATPVNLVSCQLPVGSSQLLVASRDY